MSARENYRQSAMMMAEVLVGETFSADFRPWQADKWLYIHISCYLFGNHRNVSDLLLGQKWASSSFSVTWLLYDLLLDLQSLFWSILIRNWSHFFYSIVSLF